MDEVFAEEAEHDVQVLLHRLEGALLPDRPQVARPVRHEVYKKVTLMSFIEQETREGLDGTFLGGDDAEGAEVLRRRLLHALLDRQRCQTLLHHLKLSTD